MLAVGLWLRFDPGTVELLTGDGAPETFFIGVYDATNTHTRMMNNCWTLSAKHCSCWERDLWATALRGRGRWMVTDVCPLAAVLMFYKYWSVLPFTVTRKDQRQRCLETDGAKPPADNERQIRESFAAIQIKLFMLMINRRHKRHSVGACGH